MAADESKRSAETGKPESNADAGSVEVAERDEQESDRKAESLAAGDDSVDAAIGGAGRIAGTGSSVARSGRLTSEGGTPLPNPPGAGDPGGMGGVASNRAPRHDRPPGGVSPIGHESSGERKT